MAGNNAPTFTIRTYHVTQPVGVFDRAKVNYWDACRKLEREGKDFIANAATSTIVEGVL